MITYKNIISLVFICACFNLFGQTGLSKKQQEKEANKVEMFSSEEKDSIQIRFYNRVVDMDLSDSTMESYREIITTNVYKMRRLNDKDSKNTPKMVIEKFDALVASTNKEVKPLLTKEQYTMHLKNFGVLAESVKQKFDND